MSVLNRNSFQPLYDQISQDLRAAIESHRLAPGDRVPSENELISRYAVSRNTVRLAINALLLRGLVFRVKGKGTFVAPEPLRCGLLELASFSEEMRRLGMCSQSRVLALAEEVPVENVASSLRLVEGEMVYRIERLRLANDEPMALHVSWLMCWALPDLKLEDLTQASLYTLIEDRGLTLGYADQVIKPVIASETQARLLGVIAGAPLLQVEGVSYLDSGAPVEYARLLYRGDRYEFPIRSIRRRHHSAD